MQWWVERFAPLCAPERSEMRCLIDSSLIRVNFGTAFVVKCLGANEFFEPSRSRQFSGGTTTVGKKKKFELLIYAFEQTTNFRYVPWCTGHKSQISRNRFLSFSFLMRCDVEIMCKLQNVLSLFFMLDLMDSCSENQARHLLLRHNILVLDVALNATEPRKSRGEGKWQRREHRRV